MLSERFVDVGDYVGAGEPMVTLYKTSVMEMGFTLPERHMGRVHRGQDVDIVVDAYPDRRFDAKVTFVAPNVNERSRDFLVKAKVDNTDGLLKPGAFATAGRMVPEQLSEICVRNADGSLISLSNLVELTETVGPSEIHHFNRLRSATISASNPPGVALGDAVVELEAHLGETLPAGFDYAFTGRTQDFQESFRNLTITIAFSIVFVYLVLSAQFESFIHPLIILLTLPLALVGAFGMLYVLDMPFGIVAFIGLIMLVGMATKNAILMIDYSNVLRARGVGLFDAAREAAGVRFRPVLMTTISTVLGIMPIALGYGADGEARAPMGVAVASGLTATTLLTLVVIPVVYTMVNQFTGWVAGKIRRGDGEQEASG